MRIWIACLAAYNNGQLHGAWFDLEGASLEDLQEAIANVLKASPQPGAEEWAIHDYDDETGLSRGLGENPDMARLIELQTMIDECDGQFVALRAAVDALGTDADARDVQDWIGENYQGVFDSLADWAERFMDETGGLQGVPDHLARYFDFEAYGRDAQLGGDIFTERDTDGLHVFWNH